MTKSNETTPYQTFTLTVVVNGDGALNLRDITVIGGSYDLYRNMEYILDQATVQLYDTVDLTKRGEHRYRVDVYKEKGKDVKTVIHDVTVV